MSQSRRVEYALRYGDESVRTLGTMTRRRAERHLEDTQQGTHWGRTAVLIERTVTTITSEWQVVE